jgi:hypothetical protein
MSQNVTLPTIVSPAQALAVAALAGGSTVTEAAKKAGVSRETVSRWAHRDPEFIAALQNARAQTAAEVRCGLEALGRRSVAALREVLERATTPGTKLKVACAVLKMLGADRAEPVAPTTAEEVRLRLRQREEEVRELRGKLDARDGATGRSIDATHDPEVAPAATAPAEAPRIEPPAAGGATAAGRPASGADEARAGQPADRPLELRDVERAHDPGGDQPGPRDPLVHAGGPLAEPAQQPAFRLGEGQPGGVADRRLAGGGAGLAPHPVGFFDDLFDDLDQPGAVADETVEAAAGQAVGRAGDGEDPAVLPPRRAGGRQRASAGRRRDHHPLGCSSRDPGGPKAGIPRSEDHGMGRPARYAGGRRVPRP